jgi:hypothetical protein
MKLLKRLLKPFASFEKILNNREIFIKYQSPGESLFKWYLVQVDLEEMNETMAQQFRLYIIQNYSEFKLDLHLTVPPDGRTMIHTDSNSNSAVVFKL